jgi:hypothetical protein
VITSHVHEALVSVDVIDPVRDSLSNSRNGKVVDIRFYWLAFRVPFPAPILEVADQFFLLAIDGDHGVSGLLVLLDLRVDMAKLGVPVDVLSAFFGLDIRLETVAQLSQQTSNRCRRNAETVILQRRYECSRAFVGPEKWALWIASGLGRDQSQESMFDVLILDLHALAACAWTPDPLRKHFSTVQLL